MVRGFVQGLKRLGLALSGLWFRVWGFGFWVQSLGLRAMVLGSGLGALGFGFKTVDDTPSSSTAPRTHVSGPRHARMLRASVDLRTSAVSLCSRALGIGGVWCGATRIRDNRA